MLLQQCALTASTESTLHWPKGKLRPRKPACRATKLNHPSSGRHGYVASPTRSSSPRIHLSIHGKDTHIWAASDAAVLGPPRAVNMMSCGTHSTHSPLCAWVPNGLLSSCVGGIHHGPQPRELESEDKIRFALGWSKQLFAGGVRDRESRWKRGDTPLSWRVWQGAEVMWETPGKPGAGLGSAPFAPT